MRPLAIFLVTLALAGCGVPPAAPTLADAERYWLPPVSDGSTPARVITERFGEPEVFAGGSVAAYRLIVIGAPPGLGTAAATGGKSIAHAAPARIERWWRDVTPESGVMYVVRPEDFRELTPALVGRQSEYSLVYQQDSRGVIRRHSFREVPP